MIENSYFFANFISKNHLSITFKISHRAYSLIFSGRTIYLYFQENLMLSEHDLRKFYALKEKIVRLWNEEISPDY